MRLTVLYGNVYNTVNLGYIMNTEMVKISGYCKSRFCMQYRQAIVEIQGEVPSSINTTFYCESCKDCKGMRITESEIVNRCDYQ